MVKINVDDELLSKARKKYPETKGLTHTGLTDFLIRKAVGEEKNDR